MDDANSIDFSQLQHRKQAQQIEEMKKKLLYQILTKEAIERLSRVRAANAQLAGEVELYLIQIFQAGKIRNQITDEKLKEILNFLSKKKDINITRK